MSDARTTRLPLVALGCAILAVVVAAVAAIHVLTRRSPPAAIEDRHVAATDVMKLVDGVDVVVDAGQPRGVRPKDAALARALGLGDDDALLSLSGRMTLRERDVTQLLAHESLLETHALFAELHSPARGSRIVRWIIDGDLADARRAAMPSKTPAPAQAPAPAPAPVAPSPLTNPLDTIEKLDATHVRIPRVTLYQLLASPKLALAGARIVPDARRGFVIQSVQPGSLFDRLGVAKGDTITAFNHEPVIQIDDVAAWFNNARRGTSISVDLVRSDGTPVTIDVAIR
jgi:hypothetical protein